MATSGRRSGIVGALLVGALLAVAPTALAAPPSAENVATARELYKQGADALDAKDPKTAIEKLTAAWSLVQTPVIGFDLARAHLALGHLIEAREAALAVVRVPVAPDETDRSTRARADASKLAESIEPRIPHVLVRLTNVGADRTATVKVDGVVVPTAALAVARQANPGPHTATVDVDDGRHLDASVTVAEQETKELVLALPPPPEKGPPPKNVVPPNHDGTLPPPVVARSGVSPLVWIGAATTGAGFVVGAVFGGLALSAASTVKANCTLKVGNDFVCPPAYSSDLSAERTYALVSTIGFIGAGVGVAVLVTGLILGGSKGGDKAAHVAPFIGPISGMGGTF